MCLLSNQDGEALVPGHARVKNCDDVPAAEKRKAMAEYYGKNNVRFGELLLLHADTECIHKPRFVAKAGPYFRVYEWEAVEPQQRLVHTSKSLQGTLEKFCTRSMYALKDEKAVDMPVRFFVVGKKVLEGGYLSEEWLDYLSMWVRTPCGVITILNLLALHIMLIAAIYAILMKSRN